jgi:quercetin dioxygenase-like cupin family protein
MAQGHGIMSDEAFRQVFPNAKRPGVYDSVSRASVFAWAPGAAGLDGDSLGPTMHAHDDASEIFYILSGRCRLEVGRTEHLLDPGDFALVAPEVPHNLWSASPEETLTVFWLVAPNYADNRWRTEDFRPEGYERPLEQAQAKDPGSLPSDGNIISELRVLGPDQGPEPDADASADTIVLVAEGTVTVTSAGESQHLEPGGWRHVPGGTTWSARPSKGTASVLLIRIPHRAV